MKNLPKKTARKAKKKSIDGPALTERLRAIVLEISRASLHETVSAPEENKMLEAAELLNLVVMTRTDGSGVVSEQ